MLDAQWIAGQWAEAMERSEAFSLDRNTPEQAVRHWDMLAEDYDTALGGDSRRAELVAEILRERGALHRDAVAMDIGCGTGTFALEMAKECRTVYALDYSQGMLDRLAEKAEGQGIRNVVPVHCDWRTFDPASLGEEVSLSLSCLNTGMRDRESLVKMHEGTRGTCCYITTAGAARAKNRSELQEIVFGRTLRNAGGGDVCYPFALLYAMGLMPELRYVPCAWRRTLSEEEGLRNLERDFGRYLPIDDALRERLAGYVRARLNEEGMYVEAMRAKLGVILWETE